MKGIRPDRFDYDNYHRKTEAMIARTMPFALGETRKFLPVLQWTLGEAFGKDCRYRDVMLRLQLEGITRTLEADTDWIPYLEPWHGVGVFAEAFGCPYEWRADDAPWTRPIVSNLEQLRSLSRPSAEKCPMLQYVLDTVRYFDEQTGGALFIGTTDTQSPLDTATLILDTSFFFYAAMNHPEDIHRLLSDITDLIIEFSILQRQAISRLAAPGHNAWCHPTLSGLGLSEDVLCMVGPEFFNEFARPYNERIAEKLGGVVIHSCGIWNQNFEVVKKVKGLLAVDLAIHRQYDPTPNNPRTVRDGLRGSDFMVKVRWPGDQIALLDEIFAPDLRLLWEQFWADDPVARQRNYDAAKKRFEQLCSR